MKLSHSLALFFNMVSVHFPDGQYFLSCSPHTGEKKKKKRRSLCRQARAKNKSSPSGVVVPGENWLPLLQDIEKRKPIRLIRTLFLWYLKFEMLLMNFVTLRAHLYSHRIT